MRLLLIFFIACLFIGCSKTPHISWKDTSKFSETTITLLKKGEYLALSRSFHLPSTQRISERANFYTEIEKKLAKILEIYGDFEVIEELDSNRSYLIYKTDAGSANHKKYWRDKEVNNHVYKVNYENIGEGYLITSTTFIRNKLELKEIKFGIHVNSPHAKEKINDIIRQLE